MEVVPGRQYRPRRRKTLTQLEQDEIVEAYTTDGLQQKEIALKFRVTAQLVRDLVRESKNEPEKRQNAIVKAGFQALLKERVCQVVGQWQERGEPVQNVEAIRQAVNAQNGFDVSKSAVRQILRKSLGLKYMKPKKMPPQSNSIKVLVQRQQFAIQMVRLMEMGKRIINLDETWLNETSFVRKLWAKRNGRGNMRLKTIQPRLSMISALDTDGRVWFTLTHATTDGDVIAVFLKHIIATLDQEGPGWQNNTVFLWDNAPYHASAQI